MHEGAVMQTIVETVLASLKEVGASRVAGVSLELGSSGHFSEEAVRQYFQALTEIRPRMVRCLRCRGCLQPINVCTVSSALRAL